MIELTLFFLGAALVLYAVFGGADFGAGVLESLPTPGARADQERLVTRALGPVWEANHVWLIVVVVILFNGFPEAFRHLSIAYHLPLTALLVVIVLRGCAFTFRHYDAVQDGTSRTYTRLFELSSALAPLVLGLIVGGLLVGRPIDAGTYVDRFVSPWLSLFGAVLGLFLLSLFTFVAAVFLVGESEDPAVQAVFRQRARGANLTAIVAGALTLPAAAFSGLDLFGRFLDRPLALLAVVGATLLLVPLHALLRTGRPVLLLRVLASAVFGCVLLGWFALQYPYLVPAPGGGLTAQAAAAPAVTLWWLNAALVGGSLLMFPALGYLLWVFKRR